MKTVSFHFRLKIDQRNKRPPLTLENIASAQVLIQAFKANTVES